MAMNQSAAASAATAIGTPTSVASAPSALLASGSPVGTRARPVSRSSEGLLAWRSLRCSVCLVAQLTFSLQ
jgi:hypothetical protein